MERAPLSLDAAHCFEGHYLELVGYARNRCRLHDLDHQQAEDIVQEAGLRWFRSGPEFRAKGQMLAWLRTTIRRLTLDRLDLRDPLDQDPLSLDQPWARGPDVD